ncbi:MAG: hypothetical protein ACRYGL_14040, partial [Janthinobacterium lividum]
MLATAAGSAAPAAFGGFTLLARAGALAMRDGSATFAVRAARSMMMTAAASFAARFRRPIAAWRGVGILAGSARAGI